ncbi:Bardet-Biedl syndrome 1 protein homolog isoform X2 [Diorhabda carinulata]|uniref:Bardet-Biedl syndrome 1 protein homolog isoform X2 n=1 Tax=Diorhabda carinulata TaxID=1163345 RepID=UPI0025A1CABE|nr:Bardet-Biedl syndrome 1 protein homolog isoform X2 [Diorhabda carinulata]XP_057671412.1 Bardet-Biedl syndrome 1 protein homolog isoform X2 [Diorhabda carinulata]
MMLFMDLKISRWLEAFYEQNNDLITLPGNAVLSDINGDGNYNLIINDIKLDKNRSRMRIYKGTSSSDFPLPDVPNSIISFYTDELEPRIPAIAVACGCSLYIYKNNKPFYKFQLPKCQGLPEEIDAWKKVFDVKADISDQIVDELVKDLSALPFQSLANRSQEVLTTNKSRIPDIVKRINVNDISKEYPITCMDTLNRNSNDKDDVSCPVIATEAGNIYILDPQTFNILHQANTDRTKVIPFSIKATGTFNVDFRIMIACRQGHICVLRRNWLEGKNIIQMNSNIVDFVILPEDNFIVVATTDKMINCFTKRGQRLWSVKLSQTITCLCLVQIGHIRVNLYGVGLDNGLIQLYQGRNIVDQTTVSDVPSVILFGPLGQEEHALSIITKAGTVIFRILKRTADFSVPNTENVPQFQTKPLPLPKRSKLFLEHSMRERESAVDIHQSFQKDLLKLRLDVAKSLLQYKSNENEIANFKGYLKLSAQVLGIGTKFTVIFTLENLDSTKPLNGVSMVLHVKPYNYICSKNRVLIPLLLPVSSYKVKVGIQEVIHEDQIHASKMGEVCVIRIFIIHENNPQTQPLLAATVTMPMSDNSLV